MAGPPVKTRRRSVRIQFLSGVADARDPGLVIPMGRRGEGMEAVVLMTDRNLERFEI